MTRLGTTAAGLRAARLYGQEDTEPQRASDRIKQRMQQRRDEIMGRGRTGLQSSARPSLGQPQELAPPPATPKPRDDSMTLGKAAGAVAEGSLALAGGVGNILDVPGSVVRDLLTWVPGGIEARNPVDQLLPWNWASSDGRTTEEELLESAGLYDDGPSDDRSTLTSIGRFAGELALGTLLDPLTYLSGGATAVAKGSIKGVGKAARSARALKKVGLIDDAFAAPNQLLKKAGTKASSSSRQLGKREALRYATAEDIFDATKQTESISKQARKAKEDLYIKNLEADLGDAKDAADQIEQIKKAKLGEDGYFHFGIGDFGVKFGKGEKTRRYAQALDTIGEKARFSRGGLRAARIFSKPMRGRATEELQRDAVNEIEYLKEAAITSRGMMYQPMKRIEESGVLNPEAKDANGELLRSRDQINRLSMAMTDYMEDVGRGAGEVVEGVPGRRFDPSTNQRYREQLKDTNPDTAISVTPTPQGGVDYYGDAFEELEQLGILDELDRIKEATSKALKDAQDAGVQIEGLDDPFANYATRVRNKEDLFRQGVGSRPERYDPNTEFATRRDTHLRNFERGTSEIQRMSLDQRFAGIADKKIRDRPLSPDAELNNLKNEFAREYRLEEQGFTQKQVDDLWKDISTRSREQVLSQNPFYEINPATAAEQNISGLYRAAAQAKGLRKLLKQNAVLPETRSMARVSREAKAAFGDERPVETATRATFDFLGPERMHYLDNLHINREAGDGEGPDVVLRPVSSPSGPNDAGPAVGKSSPVVDPSSPGGDSKRKSKAPERKGSKSPQLSEELKADSRRLLDLQRSNDSPTEEMRRLAIKLRDSDSEEVDELLSLVIQAKGFESLLDEVESVASVADDVAEEVTQAATATVKAPKYGEPGYQTKRQLQERAKGLGISLTVKRGRGKKNTTKSRDRLFREIAEAEGKGGVVDSSKPAAASKKSTQVDSAASENRMKHPKSMSMKALAAEAKDYTYDVKGLDRKNLESLVVGGRKVRGLLTAEQKPKSTKLKGLGLTEAEKNTLRESQFESGIEQLDRQAKRRKGKVEGSPRPKGKEYLIVLGDEDKVGKQRLFSAANKNLAVPPALKEMAKRAHAELKAEGRNVFVSPYRFMLAVLDEDLDNNMWGDIVKRMNLGQEVDPELAKVVQQNRPELLTGMVADADVRQADIKATKRGIVDSVEPKPKPDTEPEAKVAVEPEPEKLTTDQIVSAGLEDDLTDKATGKRVTPEEVHTAKASDPEAAGRAAVDKIRKQEEADAQVGADRLIEQANKKAEQKKKSKKIGKGGLAGKVGKKFDQKAEQLELFGDEAAERVDPAEEYAESLDIAAKERIAERDKEVDELRTVIDRNRGNESFDSNSVYRQMNELSDQNRADYVGIYHRETQRKLIEQTANVRPEDFPDVEIADGVEGLTQAEAQRVLAAHLSRSGDTNYFASQRYRFVLSEVKDASIDGTKHTFLVFPKKNVSPVTDDLMPSVPAREGFVYRGMAREEWEAIKRQGYVQSLGNFNIGETQDGLTFYGEAGSAQNYADGFSPWAFSPAPGVNNVVIEVPRSKVKGAGDRPGIPESEFAHEGRLDVSEITGAYELVAGSPRLHHRHGDIGATGEFDIFVSDGSTRVGSRSINTSPVEGVRQLDLESELAPPPPSNVGRTFDQPLQPSRQAMERAGERVGIGAGSRIANLLNTVLGDRFDSVLGTPAKDVASIAETVGRPGDTLVEILMSPNPAMQVVRDGLTESGAYASVMKEARRHDNAVRDINVSAIAGSGARVEGVKETLSMMGVSVPTGMNLKSKVGYQHLLNEAKRLRESGNPAAADYALSIAQPLKDSRGNLLGSRFVNGYDDPLAVAEFAQSLRGQNYAHQYGYNSLSDLIAEKPEVFASMVDDVRYKMSNRLDSSIDFGTSEPRGLTFYQKLDSVKPSMDDEGFMDIPFYAKTRRVIENEFKKDNAKVPANFFAGQRFKKEEVEFLGLNESGLFADGSNFKTRREVLQWIDDNMPVIEVVNLRKTNRIQNAANVVPGGDPSSYMEILIKHPKGRSLPKMDFPDDPPNPNHWRQLPVFADDLPTEGRDTVTNLIVHLRANIYTDPSDGSKRLRVQENQSDYFQRQDIRQQGSSERPFMRTWPMLGLRTALHIAAEQGLDGIALVDGSDIGLSVGAYGRGRLTELDMDWEEGRKALKEMAVKYHKMGQEFGKYEKGINDNPNARLVKKGFLEIPDNAVDPSSMKLDVMEKGRWYAGSAPDGKPVTIVKAQGGYRVWVDETTDLQPGAEFEMGYEDEFAGGDFLPSTFKSIAGAKKAAADFMNDPSNKRNVPLGPDSDAIDFPDDVNWSRKATVWDITPEARREILGEYIDEKGNKAGGVQLFQARDGNPGARARISFPDDVDTERWFESQYMTQITAFDQADAFSFAHEIGHLWRYTLGAKSPVLLDQAAKLFGVEGGKWTLEQEEAFADAFMDWVKAGGKSPDAGAQAMWLNFKSFIADKFRVIQKTDIERDLSPEMHQFFDDLLGEARYSEASRKTLMDVLDETKFANVRALNQLEDELGPDQMAAAKDLVLMERLKDRRYKEVQKKKKAGDLQADENTPLVTDQDLTDFKAKMSQYADPKDMPGSIDGVSTRITTQQALNMFQVPEDVGADIKRVYGLAQSFSAPEGLRGIFRAYDQFTNIFKTNVTAVWPAFHSRNFTSGFVQNALNDVYDPTERGFKKYTKPYKDSGDLMTGGVVDNASKIKVLQKPGDNRLLTDEQATEEIRRLAYLHEVMEMQGQHNDMVGVSSKSASSIIGLQKTEGLGILNILNPKSYVRTAGRAKPVSDAAKKSQLFGSMNPLDVSGGARAEGRFAAERYGRAIGDVVEGGHRLGGFIALMRQGYSPEEAAKRIKMIHVDYGDLTKGEREIARRLIPFYSYSKGMSKYIANELSARPGGKVAQSIRAANISREPDVTTPDYINQGVSLPIGSSSDGTRNYITGLGLMHEQPVDMLNPVAGLVTLGSGLDVQPTLFKLGSNLNPLIKAPLETLFNESMFQSSPQGGRSLDDMDPLIGRGLSNIGNTLGLTDRTDPVRTNKLLETVVANSPLARAGTTVRKAFDPRKGILGKAANTLTGLQLSSVSPAAQDAILRERAAELMREMGGKNFSRTYIPDYELDRMDAATRAKAEQFMELMRLLAKRAKERKAILEMQQAQESN